MIGGEIDAARLLSKIVLYIDCRTTEDVINANALSPIHGCFMMATSLDTRVLIFKTFTSLVSCSTTSCKTFLVVETTVVKRTLSLFKPSETSVSYLKKFAVEGIFKMGTILLRRKLSSLGHCQKCISLSNF